MQALGKWVRSTTFWVIAVLIVVGAAGTYVVVHRNASHSATRQVAAAPASVQAPLQVLMEGTAPSSDTSAAQSEASEIAGPPGADGAPGLDGVDGEPGADGIDGADGAEGPEGPRGPAGPAGSVGATGPAGSVGATGPAGSTGATGPAGIGLTAVSTDGGGYEIQSPDGVSYRIHVTNTGIVFEGPTTTQTWSDTSHFQSLLP